MAIMTNTLNKLEPAKDASVDEKVRLVAFLTGRLKHTHFSVTSSIALQKDSVITFFSRCSMVVWTHIHMATHQIERIIRLDFGVNSQSFESPLLVPPLLTPPPITHSICSAVEEQTNNT